MAIFRRRKLQQMLDEVANRIAASKSADFVSRLDSPDPDQALPAEYELGLIWAISRRASIEVDRPAGRRTPDIYSSDLLPSGPLLADVAAISDFSLSGEGPMRRAANIIGNFCASLISGSGNHLHYTFGEERGYRAVRGRSQFFRRRRISGVFEMSDALRTALRHWLANGPPSTRLLWEDDEIAVAIQWKDRVHPRFNTFCTMPAVTYDRRDNILYRVLKRKRDQLAAAEVGVKRAIFLGDAGCSLLREPRRVSSGEAVSGSEIIEEVVRGGGVDLVVVFSTYDAPDFRRIGGGSRTWRVHVHAEAPLGQGDVQALQEVARLLPEPYLLGYQAWSWHEQGMLNPQGRGQYLPMQFSTGMTMIARISARGLQEYVAGRLTPEQFKSFITGDYNAFEIALKGGQTIKSVRLEPKGTAEDDDYLIFEFAPDSAASPLQGRPPSGQRE